MNMIENNGDNVIDYSIASTDDHPSLAQQTTSAQAKKEEKLQT